jgi:protein-S-isoprenylcysteine O-methyltransferase Ste14
MAHKTTKDYLFVGVQFLLFLAYAWEPASLTFNRSDTMGNLGLLLAVASVIAGCLVLTQLWKIFSPFPTPVADGALITTGLFSLARHPIYSSLVLAAFGYGLYTGSGYRMLVGLALLALFFFKSSYEEQLLAAQYPEYAAYRERVGRFTPWI